MLYENAMAWHWLSILVCFDTLRYDLQCGGCSCPLLLVPSCSRVMLQVPEQKLARAGSAKTWTTLLKHEFFCRAHSFGQKEASTSLCWCRSP